MLQVEEITVRFGGLKALDGPTFEVDAGRVTGLIGPNGAGKTTMFNAVTGLLRPDRGSVRLDGADVTGVGARRRARLGIGRTFQRLEVFGSLSAADNVMVALESRGTKGRAARAEAGRLLERVGIAAASEVRADVLPTGTARLLELARALACRPKVLLLDETFSGLDDQESARLGRLLTEVASDGTAILLVEHDMEMVMQLCARIHVLEFGRLIASGTPDEIRSNPEVQAAYLGTEAA